MQQIDDANVKPQDGERLEIGLLFVSQLDGIGLPGQ